MPDKRKKWLVFISLTAAVLLAFFLINSPGNRGVFGLAEEEHEIILYTSDGDWCSACQTLENDNKFQNLLNECINNDNCKLIKVLIKNDWGEASYFEFSKDFPQGVLIKKDYIPPRAQSGIPALDIDKSPVKRNQIKQELGQLVQKIKKGEQEQPIKQIQEDCERLNRLMEYLEEANRVHKEALENGKEEYIERTRAMIERLEEKINELKQESSCEEEKEESIMEQGWQKYNDSIPDELGGSAWVSGDKILWRVPDESAYNKAVEQLEKINKERGIPDRVLSNLSIEIVNPSSKFFCRGEDGWHRWYRKGDDSKREETRELKNSQIETLLPRTGTDEPNTIYEDILNHNKPDRTIYKRQATTIHEGMHEVNTDATNDIRKKMREGGIREWDKYDGFYIGDNKYLVLEEPGIEKGSVWSLIPSGLQDSSIEYVFQPEYGPPGPYNSNYIYNEWTAEITGVIGSLELMKKNKWTSPEENKSLVMSYTFAALALAGKVKYEKSEYWRNHLEYKEFIAFNLERAKRAYDEINRNHLNQYFEIINEEQRLNYLRTSNNPKATRIREVIKEVLGNAKAKELFGI